MSVLFYIALLYIILYFFCAVLSCFSKKPWGRADQCALWGTMLCLLVTSCFVVPDDTTDLSRYYAVINWFRQKNSGLQYVAVLSISAQSSVLYLHVLILYIVSKFNSNNLLPVIWCSMTYGFLVLIIQNFTRKYKLPANQVYTGILLFFGVPGYFACVSNLRYPCLCVLFFWGVYMKLFEGKNYPLIFAIIAGLGMHLSVFMMLAIWGVYLIGRNNNLYRLILFWPLLVNLTIAVLERIPIVRLNYVAEKLYYYFNEYDETISLRLYVVYIAMLILCLAGLFVVKSHGWNKLDKSMRNYYRFIECLLLFSVGSVVNETMLKRSMILLGVSLIPYAFMLMPAFKKKNQIAFVYVFFGTGLIALSVVSTCTFFSFSV